MHSLSRAAQILNRIFPIMPQKVYYSFLSNKSTILPDGKRIRLKNQKLWWSRFRSPPKVNICIGLEYKLQCIGHTGVFHGLDVCNCHCVCFRNEEDLTYISLFLFWVLWSSNDIYYIGIHIFEIKTSLKSHKNILKYYPFCMRIYVYISGTPRREKS